MDSKLPSRTFTLVRLCDRDHVFRSDSRTRENFPLLFLLSLFSSTTDDVKGKIKTNSKLKIFIIEYTTEMYSLLIDQYIKDPVEKTRLFKAVDTIPCVQKKAEWALKWVRDLVARFARILLFLLLREYCAHPRLIFFFDPRMKTYS